MRRKIGTACCASILIVCLVVLAVAGCTRARRESPTPTVAAGAASATPLVGPTRTQVLTPQAPPTQIPAAGGPTVVRVVETTPTPSAGTPIGTAPPVPTPVPSSGHFEYMVQRYDTLFSLALRFNTTVSAIVTLNGLPDANQIRVGQVLMIPGAAAAAGGSAEYIVQPGDTLYSIASRYGTTVEAIRLANAIVNPWLIQVGQKLVIPQGSPASSTSSGATYVVQRGDTLYSIAAQFSVNVWDIVAANSLSDPGTIWVGQVLVIP
jgi:LysM repeat protein